MAWFGLAWLCWWRLLLLFVVYVWNAHSYTFPLTLSLSIPLIHGCVFKEWKENVEAQQQQEVEVENIVQGYFAKNFQGDLGNLLAGARNRERYNCSKEKGKKWICNGNNSSSGGGNNATPNGTSITNAFERKHGDFQRNLLASVHGDYHLPLTLTNTEWMQSSEWKHAINYNKMEHRTEQNGSKWQEKKCK